MRRRHWIAAMTASLAFGSWSFAQAVEWKQSDGGNGHWYQGVPGTYTWLNAKPLAESTGGHLLTLTNAIEADWVWQHVSSAAELWLHAGIFWIGPWSGAHKVGSTWVYDTGEPFWAPWCGGEPNSGYNEFYAHYYGGYGGPTPLPCWADNQNQVGSIGGTSYVIEWDADCNGDGIVDYGQIVSGELLDANGNGVPDCCESGTPCRGTGDDCNGNGVPDAIDIADGILPDCNGDGTPDDCAYGQQLIVNGSFEVGPSEYCISYSYGDEFNNLPGWAVSGSGLPIDYVRVDPAGSCGVCASVMPPDGNAFVDLIGSPGQGAIAQNVNTVVGQQYRFSFALGMNCGDTWPSLRRLQVTYGSHSEEIDQTCPDWGCDFSTVWSGYVVRDFVATTASTLIKLEALDYGGWGPLVDDIRLVRIPASCPCPGDINGDHLVNGADLSIMLGYWGPVSAATPASVDVNGSGAIDGADLAMLLAGWGVCQ